MIVFDKFWKTLEEKELSQYDLYTHCGISKYTIDRLRHNKNLETFTLDKICKALNCGLSDIAEYKEDENTK